MRHNSDHRREAEERWGGSPEYAESVRRTSSYTEADWERIDADNDAIYQGLLQLMREGVAASSEPARLLATRHREHISKWFYPCSPEIHAGLGQMYVSDMRFKEQIDQAGEGLAEYLSEAIAANSAG